MATVTVAVRMGAVGMTAAARVATGTATAVMEVVKGLRAEGRGGEDDGGPEGVEEGGGGRRRRPWRIPYIEFMATI